MGIRWHTPVPADLRVKCDLGAWLHCHCRDEWKGQWMTNPKSWPVTTHPCPCSQLAVPPLSCHCRPGACISGARGWFVRIKTAQNALGTFRILAAGKSQEPGDAGRSPQRGCGLLPLSPRAVILAKARGPSWMLRPFFRQGLCLWGPGQDSSEELSSSYFSVGQTPTLRVS